MIFEIVPFHEVAGDVANNLKNHYDPSMKRWANLDWDAYLHSSHAGACKAVTVRENGKLIAYSVFMLSVNINHKTIIEALNSGIFIDKKYRGKITAEFLKKSDEFLKDVGVMEIMYILDDDRLGNLIKRNGYAAKHKVWSKLC